MSEEDLLRTQLQAALAEGDPLEVAALAGLLARAAPSDPLLPRAGPPLGPLSRAAEAAADALLAVDEGDDPAESWDALCALDELCAAAAFGGVPGEVQASVDLCARTIRAFPEPWSAHAEAATALLARHPPRPGDPARALWAAVEASRWADQLAPTDDEAGPTEEARLALGLGVVISLRAWRPVEARLAAAALLPDDPPWCAPARGAGWELALTEDEAGQAVLLLLGAVGTFRRDGAEVPATDGPEGLACPALPGAWEVQVGDRLIAFVVDP